MVQMVTIFGCLDLRVCVGRAGGSVCGPAMPRESGVGGRPPDAGDLSYRPLGRTLSHRDRRPVYAEAKRVQTKGAHGMLGKRRNSADNGIILH